MEVRLLGPVECLGDEGPVPIPGTSARAVLAILALRAGEVVLTDEIVEGLWGASFPLDPTAAVRVTVSRLRRALGKDRERLRSVALGYVLDLTAAEVDVGRAEGALAEGKVLLHHDRPERAAQVLAAALAGWRHESPLAELADLPFASTATSRLHLLRSELVELANTAALASGRPEEVVARSERLLDADPWREELVGQLMVALYQTGRQAEALVAYSHLASLLRAEFDVEPSPALADIRSRIMAHEPSLRRRRTTAYDGSEVVPQWFRSVLDDLGGDEDDPKLRCHLRLALGEAQHQAGLPGWRETLLRAGELAEATGDATLVAKCALGGALGWSVTPGEPDERRLQLLSSALEDAGAVSDGLRARLLAGYANELTFSADLGERVRYSDQAVALARATGNPTLLLSILNQRFNAIWAPETLDTRLRDSEEASRIAEASGQRLAQEVAAGFAMAATLEAGDMASVERHFARFVSLAHDLRLPVFLWGAALHGSWRAVLAGDLETAESLSETALRIGTEADRPEARPVYLSQRAAIRWAQGRLAEEVETLQELCDSLPALPGLRAAHALSVFLGGDVRTAADLLAGTWHDGSITALPHDQLFLASLLLWAELAAALEERDVSAALFGILDPFRDRVCFNGAAVFGPVAHVLGLLAEATGDRSTALDRLDQSVRLSRRMRARFFDERSTAVVERLRSAPRSSPGTLVQGD